MATNIPSKLSHFFITPLKVELANGNLVFIRKISAMERLEWFNYSEELQAKVNETLFSKLKFSLEESAKLLSYSLADSNGKRLFSNEEIGDILQIDNDTLGMLFDKSLEFNSMIIKSEASQGQTNELKPIETEEEKAKKK